MNSRSLWKAKLGCLAFFVSGCAGSGAATVTASGATGTAKVSGGSIRLGHTRFDEASCPSLGARVDYRRLTFRDFEKQLAVHDIPFKLTQERDDLHLFDATIGGREVRFRVATLKTAREAGRHLHVALLEHGEGYWGVHRSNLAVLAPPGDLSETTRLALETGLACWGVFTTAGRDDTFVVPGGYFEF